MIFVLNSFQMLTTDTGTIQIINYCIIGIISTASVVGIISFIVWLCKSVKELPKEETVVDQTIDYNYYEDGNPEYVPYKKEESFSLAWLGSLDIKNMGELFSSICFIVGELATFYIFNELNYLSLASTTFTNNNNIRHIISSQFFITFVYFLYSYTYIIVSPTSVVNILFTISLFIGGIVGVSLSYTLTVTFTFTLRMCGGFCFGLFIFAIAFSIVKDRNQKVVDFLCPVIIVLGWFLLIVPYGIAIPIVSIYYESEFFLFVYGVILATTVLMIILVSAVSIIFNILMNKFEQEKKVKFMIEDV